MTVGRCTFFCHFTLILATDNKHEIKTYREYFQFHDLEAVFRSHSLFSEVKIENNQKIITNHNFKGNRYWPNGYGHGSHHHSFHHIQKKVLYFLLVDETAKKIQEL